MPDDGSPVRAKEPFRFFARLSLEVATGLKVRDAKELLEGIRAVSDSVLYSHTHRFLQQYQFLVPEPSNDFAVWASECLQDEALAERLMSVDVVRYNTIADLRGALAAAVDSHLRVHREARTAPLGEEFHFMRSARFSVATPLEAWDLAGFAECLKKAPVSSLYLHVFEARLRPPLGANDFSLWLERELGEAELAKRISALNPYSQTLEDLRGEVLRMAGESIQERARRAA